MRRAALALAVLAGCAAPADAPPPADPMPHPELVGATPLGAADLLPPPPAPTPPGAARRRMNVDQLGASIRAVTGGLAWEDAQGNDQLAALAATLGKPDFVDATTEDLGQSLLFQKFLGDAARDVCGRLAAAEVAEEREPVLMALVDPLAPGNADPADADANLQHLLLRFHGRAVDPADARMEPWRWLYTSTVHVTDDPVAAWRAVCVGLLTHPDFSTY